MYKLKGPILLTIFICFTHENFVWLFVNLKGVGRIVPVNLCMKVYDDNIIN